ncbi:ITA7 protein, partial [Nothoprocta ornata]|nr:ITA7 protein [Nothoprocta ornata]
RVPVPVPTALEYVLDVDTERRRRGQAPRAAFLHRRPADPEHQLSGTVELPRPGARACAQATFQLQVCPCPRARARAHGGDAGLTAARCPQDGVRDKLRPIGVTLAYGIKQARALRRAAREALPPLPPVL